MTDRMFLKNRGDTNLEVVEQDGAKITTLEPGRCMTVYPDANVILRSAPPERARDPEQRSKPIEELEPHAYVPSAMHMGDCQVCGHLQGAPIHSPFRRS